MPTNQNLYNVNWNKLITWLIPSELFKPKFYSWCKGLLAPLVTLYTQFNAYRADANFRIVTNGQICRLRGALNDKFDPNSRRITITDGVGDILYVYTDIENQPQYLPQYLSSGGGSFIVNVPLFLTTRDADIRLLIDTYKRPTKTYTINYV